MDEDKIAEKAVREGVLPPDRINWCLDLRSRIRKWGVLPPGIGEVAVQKGWITKAASAALYGVTARSKTSAEPSPPRRSFRARAADLARKRARRSTAISFVLAILAAAAALVLELLLRRTG